MGDFIRLAYADAVTGPWKVYEPGVLRVRDTAFFRPQPDPKETLADFYTHVASPEIVVDLARKRFVMWYHGWWTNGERWPSDPTDARAWAQQKGYGQFTQVAESNDGVHFTVRPAITKTSYLRVFPYRGYFYGVSRLGQLSRSADPLGTFEMGANAFRDSPYANRVRHVALVLRGSRLHVFFTAIGDAPERVLMSTIELTEDWMTWRATLPVEVLQPQTGTNAWAFQMHHPRPETWKFRSDNSATRSCLRRQAGRSFSIRHAGSRELREPCWQFPNGIVAVEEGRCSLSFSGALDAPSTRGIVQGEITVGLAINPGRLQRTRCPHTAIASSVRSAGSDPADIRFRAGRRRRWLMSDLKDRGASTLAGTPSVLHRRASSAGVRDVSSSGCAASLPASCASSSLQPLAAGLT